jgi:hypothetical protein
MDFTENLIEIIKNKKCKQKSCKDEILKLNRLIHRESERCHPGGYFSYVQYYLDDNCNLESKLEFQYCGRY